MERQTYVHKRKGRYMAQVLAEFEKSVQPLIPEEVADEFKSQVRRKMNALAVDVCDMLRLQDQGLEINGFARDLRDSTETSPRSHTPT